jgi:hypothetical protein
VRRSTVRLTILFSSHLLVMAIGLKGNDGRELANFEDDPIYKEQLQKSLQPRVPLMKEEMKHRANKAGLTRPCFG